MAVRTTTETARIADQLRRAYEGDAFHGPSLSEILSGVTLEQAMRRPIADAHTIFELVLHITAWDRECVRRIRTGTKARDLPDPENFPTPPANEEGWRRALADLKRANDELCEAVEEFPDERLGEIVSGRPFSFYVMMHGMAQHNLYHGGQIAILKKAK